MNHESSIPQILTRPRLEICRARSVWDAESAVWKTEFDYVAAPDGGRDSLRKQIDRQFGIGSQQSRVVLGDLDLLFDSSGHLLLIETRTSPRRWHRAELPPLASNLESVWADFRVELDENQIASLDLPVHITWDPAGRRVEFRFTPQPEAVTWYRLADTVAVGLVRTGGLGRFRFEDVACSGP
jgi:hypothetical protein